MTVVNIAGPIMEWLGTVLLIDGIAFMVLLLVAVLSASPPWVAVSAMGFIVLHPDLLALVILSRPSAVFVFKVSERIAERFRSIMRLWSGSWRQRRGNHKPRDGED